MTDSYMYLGRNSFLRSIEEHFNDVLKYEDEKLRKKALGVIPIDDLQLKAIYRMRKVQQLIQAGETTEPEMLLEQAVLLELMSWFKKSFFTWMDKPQCKECHSETKHSYQTTKLSAGRTIQVEMYKCLTCNAETAFPRYKDPGILLNTRTGRCGEWANCFALLCRSLNYDTRFVVDTTDHVWVEVYSYPEKRWVHYDPCENVYDNPLMYEAGWGKKLEYVIAYSKDDVQDVTWRYSSHHKAVLNRRFKCTEPELVNLIVWLKTSRWDKHSKARSKFYRKRTLIELVEMMVERKPKATETTGRTSGSLSWRLQRKELKPWTPFVWKYSQHEEVCIRYSTSKDMYEAVLPGNNQVIECKAEWMEGAYTIENIFRKEEEDWKMAYLAREEKTDSGKISWKFSSETSMKSVTVITSSTCYENGSVDWTVCNGESCLKIQKDKESNFILKDIDNLTEFTLTAQLTGGKGDLSWQHSQILRQALDSDMYPLQVIIKYKV